MKASKIWIAAAMIGVHAILGILLYILFTNPSMEMAPNAEQLEKARVFLTLVIIPFFIADLLLLRSFFRNLLGNKK